jgi:carbon storage regulator
MLVLSRKPGEKLVLGGGITVTVLMVHGDRVRVGIEAPDHVRILRAELAGAQTRPDPGLGAKPTGRGSGR